MASKKHVDLKKVENFVRSKCHPDDVSKTSLPWQPLLWLMVRIRLSNYCPKFQIENIYCSGDTEWGISIPSPGAVKCKKKSGLSSVKTEFPTYLLIVSYSIIEHYIYCFDQAHFLFFCSDFITFLLLFVLLKNTCN